MTNILYTLSANTFVKPPKNTKYDLKIKDDTCA